MKTAMCLKEYVRTSRLAGGGVSDGHCVALFIFLEYLCDVRPSNGVKFIPFPT